MNVRRGDDDRILALLDCDDPVQRMLLALCILLMPRESRHFLRALERKGTVQRDDPSRHPIVDAPAGRAELLPRPDRLRLPLPTAVMINGEALRAARRFARFHRRLVGVGYRTLLRVAEDTASARMWFRG